MTIDEAITHAEEVAEEKNKEADRIYRAYSIYPSDDDALEYDDCIACAEEHRQLAGWLKELKEKRQAIEGIRAEIEGRVTEGDVYGTNPGLKLALLIIDRHIKGETDERQ